MAIYKTMVTDYRRLLVSEDVYHYPEKKSCIENSEVIPSSERKGIDQMYNVDMSSQQKVIESDCCYQSFGHDPL